MIYDNSVIEQYKNRGSDQKKNVGEKPIVILYNYIDHHANNTTLSFVFNVFLVSLHGD